MAAAEQVEEGVRTSEEELVSEKREREHEAETRELAPWEQHSSVIYIPRFDYRAPSSLLHHSHSGFLVTCPIRREKSATKEIMSILGKYLGSIHEERDEVLESSDMSTASKKQKLCADETVLNDDEALLETGENAKVEDSKLAEESISEGHKSVMSLVKLTKSGLILFTFPVENSADTTDIVSRIFQFMESGGMKKAPEWCHRIFPVQATCGLTEKELRETVSKLVQRFVDDKNNTLSRPVKFAAGYNRRGVEETKGKIQKASEVLDQCPLLDRNKCFATVAAGVKDIVPDSVVDLKTPELCVLVELLPLSRIPNGAFVAAVSVLPPRLVSTKPKLAMKPLVPETKQKKGKTN